MIIEHVFHSGMKIDLGDYLILIDVFEEIEDFNGRKIYCLSSHGHGDHFSPKVFDLRDSNDVTYIFSDDIEAEGEDIHFVKEGDQVTIGDLDLRVYGSTDLGVSFLIKASNQVFFHSGDLNWWHWKTFNLGQLIDEELQFKAVVDQLIGQEIDYYFLPVDYRLEEHGYLAYDYVIGKIKPRFLIPMHFADHYDYIKPLLDTSSTRVLKAEKRRHVLVNE